MCRREKILFACGCFHRNSWSECSQKDSLLPAEECPFKTYTPELYTRGPLDCDEHDWREIFQREKDKIDICVAQQTVYFPDAKLRDRDRKTLVKRYGAKREEAEQVSKEDAAQTESKNSKALNPMGTCYEYLRNIGRGKSNLSKIHGDFSESQTRLLGNIAPLATSRRAVKRSGGNSGNA